jgi:orotidine-5'-phosphate decarboxylase
MNTPLKKAPQDYLALALDNVNSLDQLTALVNQTRDSIGIFKIGLEQFTRFGLPVIETIKKTNRKIFLDLKFHDIPNTVAKAVSSACELGVDYLTIHTQGGTEMMKAAAKAANDARQKGLHAPKLIGVTVLTSISVETLHSELGVSASLIDHVKHCAQMAAASGLNGIVCSAADLPYLKSQLAQDFEVITPGIRFEGGEAHDQKRVATPKEAIANGSTILVVGRIITQAANPAEAAKQVIDSITA